MPLEPAVLQLFGQCCLPGCRNLVADPDQLCDECSTLFDGSLAGWTIRRCDHVPAETAEQVAARKREQAAAQTRALTRPGPERKMNQRCWLCEQRRSCTQAPMGWECDTCYQP